MHARVDSSRAVIAGVNALFRMKETRRRGPRILEDAFAAKLADERLLLSALRYSRFALPSVSRILDQLQTAHCVRHRAIDELVLRAVDDGFRQVVVVGAGFDMRPTRFADRIREVRWYELDRAEIIATKRRRLGRAMVRPYESGAMNLQEEPISNGHPLGQSPLGAPRLAPLGSPISNRHPLGQSPLGAPRLAPLGSPILRALAPTSFDSDWDTLFVCEGILHFLTPTQLEGLLGDCAEGRGRRRVVMSFIDAESYVEPDARLSFLLRLIDDVTQLQITPAQLAGWCARQRLCDFTAFSYAQQVERFAPEAAGRAVSTTGEVAQVELTLPRS